jgi:hypothetical protein
LIPTVCFEEFLSLAESIADETQYFSRTESENSYAALVYFFENIKYFSIQSENEGEATVAAATVFNSSADGAAILFRHFELQRIVYRTCLKGHCQEKRGCS